MPRMTIYLTAKQKADLKARAAELDLSVSEYVRDIFYDETSEDSVTQKLDKIITILEKKHGIKGKKAKTKPNSESSSQTDDNHRNELQFLSANGAKSPFST